MNAAQKKLVLAAAVVVAVVLHFWFCRWEVSAPYTSFESVVGMPPEQWRHVSEQIAGINTKAGYHESFTGLAARTGSSTTAMIGGLLLPFVLLVAACLPFLTTAPPANPKRSP